jgi:hypothetical protein
VADLGDPDARREPHHVGEAAAAAELGELHLDVLREERRRGSWLSMQRK